MVIIIKKGKVKESEKKKAKFENNLYKYDLLKTLMMVNIKSWKKKKRKKEKREVVIIKTYIEGVNNNNKLKGAYTGNSARVYCDKKLYSYK